MIVKINNLTPSLLYKFQIYLILKSLLFYNQHYDFSYEQLIFESYFYTFDLSYVISITKLLGRQGIYIFLELINFTF